jgi:hypothetical protein
MVKYQLSEHAEDMLRERNISEEWIQFTLNYPEQPSLIEG